jgi:formate/nitrite transporter FocA (FNT family)
MALVTVLAETRSMPDEQAESEARRSPSGKIVYEAIRAEGNDELLRPNAALAWSGLAAGLSMGFSFLGVGMLQAFLPKSDWAPLITSFGYTLGFLIVILGRQQLFTENTLTVILPLLAGRTKVRNVARLWAVVLAANTVGALVFAYVLARTQAVDSTVYTALRDVANDAAQPTFAVALLRGVFAGWLIALIVWLLPFAESARVWVIVIITYIVGLGHLSHVIAGAVEAAFLVFVGESDWGTFVTRMFVPALIGNIIGGVALVASLNHAQVTAGEGVDT